LPQCIVCGVKRRVAGSQFRQNASRKGTRRQNGIGCLHDDRRADVVRRPQGHQPSYAAACSLKQIVDDHQVQRLGSKESDLSSVRRIMIGAAIRDLPSTIFPLIGAFDMKPSPWRSS
jgi:hypothetical protein